MADKKITDLPDLTSADSGDYIPIVDISANITKKMPASGLVSAIPSASIPAAKIDFGGAGAGIWWEEIGRVTLGSAANTMTVSSLPNRKYLRLVVLALPGSASNNAVAMRFNGDTANNYAFRSGDNGAADGLTASASALSLSVTAISSISMMTFDIVNLATSAKLVHGTFIDQGAGATAASHPQHREMSGKWVNTSTVISSVTIYDTGSVTFAAGSEIIVLGRN